jgi:hypothetical protein
MRLPHRLRVTPQGNAGYVHARCRASASVRQTRASDDESGRLLAAMPGRPTAGRNKVRARWPSAWRCSRRCSRPSCRSQSPGGHADPAKRGNAHRARRARPRTSLDGNDRSGRRSRPPERAARRSRGASDGDEGLATARVCALGRWRRLGPDVTLPPTLALGELEWPEAAPDRLAVDAVFSGELGPTSPRLHPAADLVHLGVAQFGLGRHRIDSRSRDISGTFAGHFTKHFAGRPNLWKTA